MWPRSGEAARRRRCGGVYADKSPPRCERESQIDILEKGCVSKPPDGVKSNPRAEHGLVAEEGGAPRERAHRREQLEHGVRSIEAEPEGATNDAGEGQCTLDHLDCVSGKPGVGVKEEQCVTPRSCRPTIQLIAP